MQTPKRLPTKPPRERIPESERADYDAVVARTERLDYPGYDLPARYFGALVNAPSLAAGLASMGRLVREGERRGTYSDAERELIDVVLAKDTGYNGILTVHIPDALAVGVRIEAIDAIRAGREQELTPQEREIADYSREVVAGTVSDESFATMQERFGERGAIEFTVFVGFLMMTIRLWQALGVPNPSDDEIDALLDDLRSGRTPVPDPSARIG